MIRQRLEQALAWRLCKAGWEEWEAEILLGFIFHPIRSLKDDVS